jgi:hypothetical protein
MGGRTYRRRAPQKATEKMSRFAVVYGRTVRETLEELSGILNAGRLLGLAYWEQKPRDSNDRLASVLQHTGRPTKRADRTT